MWSHKTLSIKDQRSQRVHIHFSVENSKGTQVIDFPKFKEIVSAIDKPQSYRLFIYALMYVI